MKTIQWLDGLKESLARKAQRLSGRRSGSRRCLSRMYGQSAARLELLEDRLMLTAIDELGEISGVAFQDLTTDGLTADDILLPGAVMNLYLDGGNGTLDSDHGIVGGDDTLIGTPQTTDGNGRYSFTHLGEGTYFVEEHAVPSGLEQFPGHDVVQVQITPAQAQGLEGGLIDDFVDPTPAARITASAGLPDSVSSISAALGGTRDMFVEVSGVGSDSTVELRADNIVSLLELVSSFGTTGRGIVTYDGDNNPNIINHTGLGGFDLTEAGASIGLKMSVGASSDTAKLMFRVYTDATHASEATLSIPNTGAATLASAVATFDTDFTQIGADGPADFANVGAIELELDALEQRSTTIVADYVKSWRPFVVDANFSHFRRMELGGSVFLDRSGDGMFDANLDALIGDVALTLFEDINGNNTYDAGTDTQVDTTVETGGIYRFTDVIPGDYLVRVDASNFRVGGSLEHLSSDPGVTTDPDNNIDNDDNGTPLGASVFSQAITLSNLAEPDVGEDGDGTDSNQTLDFGFTGTVDIELTKSDNVDPVTAGSGTGNLIYTIVATNLGPLDATGLIVQEDFVLNPPQGFTLESAIGSNGTTLNTATGEWDIGTLHNQSVQRLTLTFTVDATASSGTVTNTVSVAHLDERDSNSTNDTASETTTIASNVDIVVSKSDNVSTVIAGSGTGNLIYTVTARNVGPSNATGVSIEDAQITNLPPGFRFESASGTNGTTFNAATGIWTVGNLAAGSSEVLTLTMTVDSSAPAGTVNNTVVATVNENDINLDNNTDTENTAIARNVDIALTKTDSVDPVTAGSGPGNLVYTITATNNGPSDASGLVVSDVLLTRLPEGFTKDSIGMTVGTLFDVNTGLWDIGELPSQETVTLVATITVDETAADGTFENVARVISINEVDTDLANNTASEITTVAHEVDVALTKSDNADSVTAGSGPGNLIYTVTATNNGPSSASSVRVSDVLVTSLPTGFTLDSATGTSGTTFDAATGIWDIGRLPVGVEEILTITLTVDASATAGTITNEVRVSNVLENDSNSENDVATVETAIDRFVDIEVTKGDNTDPVIAGSDNGNLIYTLTATNKGLSNASGVVVSDRFIPELPDGFTLDYATGSNGTAFDARNGEWNIGDLPAGETRSLTLTFTVDATAAEGVVTNAAQLVSVNEEDSDSTNDSTSETTTVLRNVDIVVSKSADHDEVIAGSGSGNLIYTVTATNDGPSDATGVSVADEFVVELPTGFILQAFSGTNDTTFNATTGIWTIGDLAHEATETLTLTLTANQQAASGTITNEAVATSNETDINTANNTATEETQITRHVDIAVTKHDEADIVTAGSGEANLVYYISARNNGPSDASGVVISDAFLASLPFGFYVYTAASTANTSYDYNTGLWTVGDLASQHTETLKVLVTVGESAADGTVENVATVAQLNELDTDSTNDAASVTTEIVHQVDVAVTKSDNVDRIIAGRGETLIYTITAANNGPSSASGLTVTDELFASLPAGFTLIASEEAEGTSFDETTGVWNIGTLNDNDSRTLTLTFDVGPTAPHGLLTNVVTVSSLNEPDSDVSNDSATETTFIESQVDVGITKIASTDDVIAGSGPGNLTYTITASNAGPVNATGVDIADQLLADLPSGIQIHSVTSSGGTTFDTSSGVWTIGNLAANDSRVLTVALTVGASVTVDSLTNIAVVYSVSELDSNAANDSASVTTTIKRPIDLALTKTDLVDPIQSPGQIQYRIEVTNLGHSTATNVTLTDTLSTHVSFQSASASQGTVTSASGVVIGELGTLAPGETAIVTLTVNTDLPQGGTIDNTASVTASEFELIRSNNTDTASTQIIPGLYSVSGSVFEDLNGNNILDNFDTPIPGTLVGLFGIDNKGAAVFLTTRSNQSGYYQFTDLSPGEYNLFEVQPGIHLDGEEQNHSGANVTVLNDAFIGLQLGANRAVANLNFGEGQKSESKRDFLASNQVVGQNIQPTQPLIASGHGSLSGRVALDANGNGIFDFGDAGMAGVTVTLMGVDTFGNTVLITQATAADGTFKFSRLPAGTYSILESQPPRVSDGPDLPGTLLPASALDDLFSTIALPHGGDGSGFTFLERPLDFKNSVQAGGTAPVLAGQAIQPSAQPVLAWTNVGSATQYDLWLSRDGDGLVYRNQTVNDTSLQIPMDLNPGPHSLWVRAITDGQPGPWSERMALDIQPGTRVLNPVLSSVDATPTFELAGVANSTGYELVVRDADGNQMLHAESMTSSTYQSATELPEGEYRAWARTFVDGVAGPWSEGSQFSITEVPIAAVPRTPSVLTAPLLEWSSNTGTTEVWLGNVTSGELKRIHVETVNGNSLLIPEVLPEGNYRYWVRDVDAQGNKTAWSAPVNFDVVSRPTVLTPDGNVSGDSFEITWTPVTGATHYDVWVSDNSGLVLREQRATGTSHTFHQSLDKGTHRVWVRPMGVHSNGTWSNELRFTKGGLNRPVLTGPSTSSDRTQTFTWNAVPKATRYELWIDHEGVQNKLIHETDLTGTSYTSASLPAGNYRIWLRAMNGDTTSFWSAPQTLKIT